MNSSEIIVVIIGIIFGLTGIILTIFVFIRIKETSINAKKETSNNADRVNRLRQPRILSQKINPRLRKYRRGNYYIQPNNLRSEPKPSNKIRSESIKAIQFRDLRPLSFIVILIIAGAAIVLRISDPVVWTFLASIIGLSLGSFNKRPE